MGKAKFERLAKAIIYAEFQCNDNTDTQNPRGEFALIRSLDKIPNKSELSAKTVSPTFGIHIVDDKTFLFVEFAFSKRESLFRKWKRDLVFGCMYTQSTERFIKAAESLGYFWLNDSPDTATGIQLPVVKRKMLTELRSEFAQMKQA